MIFLVFFDTRVDAARPPKTLNGVKRRKSSLSHHSHHLATNVVFVTELSQELGQRLLLGACVKLS